MFTIKFFRAEPSEGQESEVIACQRYSVVEGKRTMIWMYPTYKKENPILLDLHQDEDETTYYECFIENIAGKTISRYRAWE